MQLALPFAVLAVFISSVSAQLPDCATTCILSADTGSCSQTDNSCLCRDQAFITSTTSCIESTCSGSDLQAALSAAQELCAQVGVTLSAPSSTAGGASSTASSGSTSAGSASTTPTSPASSGASSPASSSSSTAPTTSPTTNAAVSNSVNAIAALGAVAVAAFAL